MFKRLGPIIRHEADTSAVDRIVQRLRADCLEPGSLDDETIILTTVLEELKLLNHYFYQYERKAVKERLQALREDPRYSPINELLTEIETFYTLAYAVITVFIAVT